MQLMNKKTKEKLIEGLKRNYFIALVIATYTYITKSVTIKPK